MMATAGTLSSMNGMTFTPSGFSPYSTSHSDCYKAKIIEQVETISI